MGLERIADWFGRIRRRGDRAAKGDHPTPELLASYQANELTAEENAAIQEHFSRCRGCSEMLLDFQAFKDPSEEETVEITEPRLATAWQRLRARLALESERVGWPARWTKPRIKHPGSDGVSSHEGRPAIRGPEEQ